MLYWAEMSFTFWRNFQPRTFIFQTQSCSKLLYSSLGSFNDIFIVWAMEADDIPKVIYERRRITNQIADFIWDISRIKSDNVWVMSATSRTLLRMLRWMDAARTEETLATESDTMTSGNFEYTRTAVGNKLCLQLHSLVRNCPQYCLCVSIYEPIGVRRSREWIWDFGEDSCRLQGTWSKRRKVFAPSAEIRSKSADL